MENFEKVKNKFKEHNYILKKVEEDELKKQLKRKHYLIYIKYIDFISKNDVKKRVEYSEVVAKIKFTKRLVKTILHLLIAIEENIRTQQLISCDDWDLYLKHHKKNRYFELIDNSELLNCKDKKTIHNLRKIRNNFAHLKYLDIEDDDYNEEFIINNLTELKNIKWVDSNVIDECIKKIEEAK